MEGTKRILIVDDDENSRRVIQAFLESLGHEFVIARDGFEALEMVTAEIDLVLMDVVMPGMSGFEVVRRMRTNPVSLDVPIIMVTALSERKHRIAAVEAGANDFISKPVDRLELQVRMASLLRMREAQHELLRTNADLRREIQIRRLTEVALRESEARYRDLFEQASDLMYIHDIRGNYQRVNAAVEQILGYTPEEFLKLNFRDIIAPGHLPAVEEHFRRKVDGELDKTGPYEVLVLSSSGNLVWLEVTSRIIRRDGKPVAIQGIGRDITERKRIEEDLRQSEAKYRTIFENSPLGLFHFDAEGTITACNDNFVQIIGSSREKLVGLNTMRDLKDQAMIAAISEALSGRIGHYEGYYSSVTADKTTPTKCDFGPLIGEDNSVIGGIGIVEDITSRKKTETALRQSEEKYRTILETIVDGYYEVDLEGRLILLNDAMEEMLGQSREELIARDCRTFLDMDDIDRVFQAFNTVQRTGKPNPGVSARMVRTDGSHRDVTISIALTRDSRGAPSGFRGIIRDITERKALEEQLRQAAKMQAIGQLAGGIAHDFNNLLTAIIGYCAILMQQALPGDPHIEKLAQIDRAAKRAADLTQQLLAYGRKQVLQAKHMDLNATIRDIGTMLRRIIGETIVIETSLDPELQIVHADPSQLEQIILNLAVNARDAMAGGGTLRIETWNAFVDETHPDHGAEIPSGDYVVLTVTDNGTGMDSKVLPRIFDPFFTTKEKGVGTGLGLSTVYGIVKQHQGHITVRSKPGVGTTFRVYLPAADAEQADRHHATIEEQPEPTGSETVLVVEDEEVVRDLTCESLSLLGYRPLPCADPAEALATAEDYEGTIHVLLTDVVLPQMDGRSLYNELVKLHPNVQVLYMSGYTEDFIVHRGILDPEVRFLQKPFTVTQLAKSIAQALGKKTKPLVGDHQSPQRSPST
ncbi:MAG: PAS domain S-box protein [Thermodesulfobacteriota bacterium]